MWECEGFMSIFIKGNKEWLKKLKRKLLLVLYFGKFILVGYRVKN